MTKEQVKKELGWLEARLNTSLPDWYQLSVLLRKEAALEEKLKEVDND